MSSNAASSYCRAALAPARRTNCRSNSTSARWGRYSSSLVVANHCLGFLMLAAPPTVQNWSNRDRAIIPGVAAFIAQAIANSRRLEEESGRQTVAPVTPAAPRPADPDRERLILELADTRRMLSTAEERARQAETMAVFLQQREPGQPTAARPQVAQAAIGPAVEHATGIILPILRQKNLKLDTAIGESLPLVAVKEGVLRQLVLSLLENAVRASPEDGCVLVRAEPLAPAGGPLTARAVTLSVGDSGAGIRAEDHKRVFDSQYYLSGGRPIAGLGDNSAGLAVVQKLAQAGGGDLTFESAVGVGTTFTLRLPAAEVRPWTLMKIKQPVESGKLSPTVPTATVPTATVSTTPPGEAE
jgi:signal transduction histidine kinase